MDKDFRIQIIHVYEDIMGKTIDFIKGNIKCFIREARTKINCPHNKWRKIGMSFILIQVMKTK